MAIKADELKSGMILKHNGELCKFIKLTPKTIKFKTEMGWERYIKKNKGWNLRFDYVEMSEKEFDIHVENKWLERDNNNLKGAIKMWKGQLTNARAEIKALKKKDSRPVWFEIKPNNRVCTNDYIIDFVKAIQPISDAIFLNWGPNNGGNKKGFPISLHITASHFDCTEKYLSDLLKAIQPHSNIIHIEYGRY